ncbi:hypothetical protein [Alkalibacillus haloalkaliphilus]|uniref:Lipoprotein n=1 Tax=Alkalibacillus haloalkaliphilus TaxID=94136 RepID=A0A511W332_9BACI|nr:hypothetical protein [Alkalibacillus haloalkaliphilus]GEN45496.1 hypothetical protein AHA02nite_12720 [Alkalibacillus haloalkaliphilus]
MKVFGLFLLIFLLSACNEAPEETITLSEVDFAEHLVVSKVIENRSDPNLSKGVTDQELAQSVLEKVKGLSVVEHEVDDVAEKLRKEDYYMFTFNDEQMESGDVPSYHFVAFTDGKIAFYFEDVDQEWEPRVTVDAQKALIEEIKRLVKVDF